MIKIESGERSILATWSDHSVTELPFIWLRDNDQGELHPETHERTFDLNSVVLDLQPKACHLATDSLVVQWHGKADPSEYASAWLLSHLPGNNRQDPSSVEPEFWNAETSPEIPHFDSSACAESAQELHAALLAVKTNGLIIFDDLDDHMDAGERFGDLIGFKRRTNFGLMFEVISKPVPVNLAYTSIALPLHTDLPNQVLVPGYQFLHSYRNSATGGESHFADGFQICADLEREAPDNLDLLMRVSVPWRFHDQDCDIRSHRPIISKKPDGSFDCIVFNAHLADIPDMESKVLYDFYAAYHDLMLRIRDPRYLVRHTLTPGQMVMFDNRRVLHGRSEFDPPSGNRHFRGYYIESNEVNSRIRVLARELSSNPLQKYVQD